MSLPLVADLVPEPADLVVVRGDRGVAAGHPGDDGRCCPSRERPTGPREGCDAEEQHCVCCCLATEPSADLVALCPVLAGTYVGDDLAVVADETSDAFSCQAAWLRVALTGGGKAVASS